MWGIQSIIVRIFYRITHCIGLIEYAEDYHVSFGAHTNAVLTLKWSNDDTSLVR